jgi:hypothetical protein
MIIRKQLRQRKVIWCIEDGNEEYTTSRPRSFHPLGQAGAIKSHRNTRKR